MTAAHCVKNAIYIQAAGGRLDLTQTTSQEFGAAYQVFYTFIHSEYAQNTSANDIALLGLKQSNNYGTSPIQPVKISTNISSTNMSNISAISLTALGWGLNSSVSQFTSPSLMQANLTIISQEACAKEYSLEVITEKIFCAGHNNFATCKGTNHHQSYNFDKKR